MQYKEFLESLVSEKAPGPRPSFSVFDVIKFFEIVSEKGAIGRGKIADEIELGEGATRTLITRLTEAGLIVAHRSGCSPAEKGRRIWNSIRRTLPLKIRLEKNELIFAAYSVAVLIRGHGETIKKGLEQRDAAVAVGAKGATTLLFKDNKLVVPMISADVSKDFPIVFSQITSQMKLEENDVVIICNAERLKEAEYGALAAAWSII